MLQFEDVATHQLIMPKHNTQGYLITFCGLDGCGKSTMIKMLADFLKSNAVQLVLTKQPTDFVRQSEIFRTFMDAPDHEAFDYRCLSLLAAGDRIQHCNKVILPALQQDKWVISDRYIYSCFANLRARGFTEDQWIYEIAGYIIRPDIAFFLDVPVDVAVSRVKSRESEKDRYIDIDLQYKLRDKYLRLSKANGGFTIQSDETPEQTFSQIKNIICDLSISLRYKKYMEFKYKAIMEAYKKETTE